jgi:hypothetical protein
MKNMLRRHDYDVNNIMNDWRARSRRVSVVWNGRPAPFRNSPGNHEYCGHDIEFTNELEASAPDNVRVLQGEAVEIGGVRFAGCAMWTDFRLYGEGKACAARRRAGRMLNDFPRIRNGDGHLRRRTPLTFTKRAGRGSSAS